MAKALADFFAEVLQHGALRFSGGSATVSQPPTPAQSRCGGPVGRFRHLEVVHAADVLDDAPANVIPESMRKAKCVLSTCRAAQIEPGVHVGYSNTSLARAGIRHSPNGRYGLFRRGRTDHSALMLAARITLPHFSASSSSRLP